MTRKIATENTKKAAGNAKKAEAAAQKASQEDAKKASLEDEQWSQGAKSTSKKVLADAKRFHANALKHEREALLHAEELNQRIIPRGANSKTAVKKTRGLDLSALDAPSASSSNPTSALNATGIDNALDALSLTSSANTTAVDRHPERRFKAAYAAYEARRLPELEEEMKGLRRNQRIEVVKKEFEKSEENPFNQVSARFDASKEDVKAIREGEREKVEKRLVS